MGSSSTTSTVIVECCYLSFLNNDAVNLEVADRKKKISKTGKSFAAFGLEEGPKTKEPKVRALTQPEISEKETFHYNKSANADGNFDKGDRRKGFEEDDYTVSPTFPRTDCSGTT